MEVLTKKSSNIMVFFPELLLFLAGVILTIGDIFMKKWVNANDFYLFIIGIVLYLISMCILGYSFKFKNIAIASTMMVVFNVVTLAIVSWIFYGDKLSTWQIVGISTAMVSVVLCEL